MLGTKYQYFLIMSQSSQLITTIKRELKSRQLSYRALAEHLDLSESAVKQMFSTGNFTLKRLDAICELLGLAFIELAQLANTASAGLDSLSLEQEERLVGDPVLLLVAYCVVNQWSFEEIITRYRISETQCIGKLVELDRLRMAELTPGNRIRALIGVNFKWQPNGPIEQYFRREVQDQFFDNAFDDEDAVRLVKSGDVSMATFDQLLARMNSVGQLFDDLAREDIVYPSKQRYGTSMILAIRRWELAAFKRLERKVYPGDA